MKLKKVRISVLILMLIIVGVYFFLKLNPPLEIGTLASGDDKRSVVVGVGNKGFQEVKLLDVLVNNDDIPLETKIQVSNALQGFIITDHYNNEEAEEYTFMNINEVAVKTGTSPTSTFKKLDDGTATKNDEIYGINVFYDKEINKVDITYSYLGIQFIETVTLN